MATKGLEQVSKDEPVKIGDFTVVHNSDSDDLEFKFNGNTILKITKNGVIGQ